jgi:hypothetical protein
VTIPRDVIGDVHGQYDKLVSLLRHLGYSESAGAWRHPDRAAIFVGDLIDRGPKQLATVDLVRSMVEAGTARCVLGNHEFNAIAWATRDPAHPNRFLRTHSKHGHRKQHHAFLREVEGKHRHAGIIAWFKTLPLWLDLGGVRVVHACWHEKSMDVLRPLLGPDHSLTEEVIRLGSRRGEAVLDSAVFDAIEVVCKGPEVPLPEGITFKDKEGKVRDRVRIRWWLPGATNFRDAAIVMPGDEVRFPDTPLPAEWKGHPYIGPPVLFGHYWFTGEPAVCSGQFACLDYSAARSGPLMAYRWDGERDLSSAKLAWVAQ